MCKHNIFLETDTDSLHNPTNDHSSSMSVSMTKITQRVTRDLSTPTEISILIQFCC